MALHDSPETWAAYHRDRYARHRQEFIDLLGDECVRCQSTNDLQIDHIDPKLKKFSIFPGRQSLDDPLVRAELEKCQLLCFKCHCDKTAQEKSVGHGGGLTGKKNCRCALCAPLKNAWMREYKKKRRARASNPSSKI